MINKVNKYSEKSFFLQRALEAFSFQAKDFQGFICNLGLYMADREVSYNFSNFTNLPSFVTFIRL